MKQEQTSKQRIPHGKTCHFFAFDKWHFSPTQSGLIFLQKQESEAGKNEYNSKFSLYHNYTLVGEWG